MVTKEKWGSIGMPESIKKIIDKKYKAYSFPKEPIGEYILRILNQVNEVKE